MTKLKPTEIAAAVFREGRWAGLYPQDPSLRRGFQILMDRLQFPGDKLPLHYDLIRFLGATILSNAKEDPSKQGQLLVDADKIPPVEFDIEGINGFKPTAVDAFDKRAIETRIDGIQFRTSLKQAYIKALQSANPAEQERYGVLPETPENKPF